MQEMERRLSGRETDRHLSSSEPVCLNGSMNEETLMQDSKYIVMNVQTYQAFRKLDTKIGFLLTIF